MEIIEEATQKFVSSVDEYTKSVRQFMSFRYMNYAWLTQDVIESYGRERMWSACAGFLGIMIRRRCSRDLCLEGISYTDGSWNLSMYWIDRIALLAAQSLTDDRENIGIFWKMNF